MRAAGGDEEIDANELPMEVAAAQDDDQLSFEVVFLLLVVAPLN